MMQPGNLRATRRPQKYDEGTRINAEHVDVTFKAYMLCRQSYLKVSSAMSISLQLPHAAAE